MLTGCLADRTPERSAPAPLGCTYDQPTWARRCASAPASMHGACAHLEDAWPERAALRLDLAASEHGLTPAGLADRTLAVGAHSGQSLSALLDQALATETPDEGLRRAVSAASHGFDGCVDRGALVALEQVLVCGEERRVTGPEGAACRALDDECGRGYFDEAQACCALRPRALGVGCAEGSGRCDGNGACIPMDAQDGMAVELPEDVDAAIGLPSWVDHTSVEAPSVWLTNDGMQLGLGGQTMVELSGADGVRIPYDAVHLLGDGADRSAAGVIVDVPGVLRSLHLEPRADWVVAHDVSDDAGAAEPTEAAPAASAEPLRVVAVLQSSGDLSSALGDVGAAGRVELGCPGEASGIRCELSEGGVTVSGHDLGFASVSHGMPRNIMPTALYGSCFSSLCWPPPPVCHYPQAQSCTAPCGKAGLRYCTWNGSWGTCHAYGSQAEVCNGLDDDCDGQIDENGSAICDDGLTCNVDSCDSQPGHYVPGYPWGHWVAASGTCKHVVAPSCADSHTCATSICSATVPTTSVAGHAIGTINVLNDCYEELDSNYCTNTWDACNCNGPEFCAPTGNLDPSGCVMSPGSAAPCEADDDEKPDNDDLHGSEIDPYNTIHHPGGACTIEACVEDSTSCNWAHIGLADPDLLAQAQSGWAFSMRRASRHHAGTLYTRPDGTDVQVQCPDNKIWGQKTYLEPGCDDNNSCTDDLCNPMLGPLVPGGCMYTPVPLPTHCDPRPTANHVANAGGELACGILNYSCSATAVCVPSNPATSQRPPNCTPVPVSAPSGTVPNPFYRRSSFTPSSNGGGWNYEYGSAAPHRVGLPSCHRAMCANNGSCAVDATTTMGLDPGACTAGHGCIADSCSAATDVMDSNGVVGCAEHASDGLCPTPAAGDCRIRPIGACQPDGSCVLLPNDSKCASRLSPANECLLATCQADGSCGITEDTNLCDFGCGPTEAASQPTCERHTTAGREYGICRSLGCIPFN